jgi:predicted ester cyclase
VEGDHFVSAEENKRLAAAFFERIWNQGDESAIDEFIPVNAAGNDPDFGSGREGFRAQWRKWRVAFPDLHFECTDFVAEGDKVLTRWTLTGTHMGEFLGAAPTGKKIKVEGMSLDRIENGLVAEGFDGWDNLGFRQQLGLIKEDAKG